MTLSAALRGPALPSQPCRGPPGGEYGESGSLPSPRALWVGGCGWGQAEGCVLQSSQALTAASHWLGPGLEDLMAAAAAMGRGPWRPQRLDYMDTAIEVTASTSFSLSIQVSKIGAA